MTPFVAYPGPLALAEPDPAGGDNGSAPALGPSELLNALRRQWLLGAVLGLVVSVAAAGAAWFLQKPKYTSTAFLRISARDATLIFPKKKPELVQRGKPLVYLARRR